MTISVSTLAPTTLLTTVDRVKESLGLTSATDDGLLLTLARAASAAVVSFCGRSFAREAVVETVPAYGDIHLAVSRTPLISVSAVLLDGQVITDYSIGNRDKGWIYRRAGWAWTDQCWQGLSGDGRFFDIGTPMPRHEEPAFSATYVGGYILPPQYRLAALTLSAAAADNSFNDSGSLFPSLLKAGDVVEAVGWTAAANNGRFLVTGTPTAGKIVVSGGPLVDEASGSARTLLFGPPPDCRAFDDVERACIETVKTWYLNRKEDSSVIEKELGPARLRLGENVDDPSARDGLPPMAARLLRHWVRVAA